MQTVAAALRECRHPSALDDAALVQLLDARVRLEEILSSMPDPTSSCEVLSTLDQDLERREARAAVARLDPATREALLRGYPRFGRWWCPLR